MAFPQLLQNLAPSSFSAPQLVQYMMASSWQLLVRVEKDPFDESAHERTVLLYGIILLEAVVEVGVKPLCH